MIPQQYLKGWREVAAERANDYGKWDSSVVLRLLDEIELLREVAQAAEQVIGPLPEEDLAERYGALVAALQVWREKR